MPGLRLQNLCKVFAVGRTSATALDRLNLDASPGELLVVLGPSGCGKTTLLRLIAGLDQPTSGEITLQGETIVHEKAQERSIGMAFQYPALLPQLNVAENISLGPKLRGIPEPERSTRTRELAELLRISDLLPRLPETLSGGQQQRVSLARVLAIRPALLLLDEPLANLDPVSRNDLRATIRSVQQKLGVTTIYVTHDQAEAAAVADRIAILDRGTLQQIGKPCELYSDPTNLFVATFFAPEPPNMIHGAIKAEGFRPNSSDYILPTHLSEKEKVTCVIRPRALHPGGSSRGIVEHVQQSGWGTSIILNVSGISLRAELSTPASVQVGAVFPFSVDASATLFFDDSGHRLR